MPSRLILASASPRRLALLAQIGITPDEVISADIDESLLPGESPRAAALRLAHAKAAAIGDDLALVLAADTVVAVGRRVLPKAETADQARACLDQLSGRRHHVMTGLVLRMPDGRVSERLTDTQVVFVRLTEQQKRAYIDGGEWQGKAGGYAIQGHAACFVRSLSGSYSGVVGLPLFEAAQLLRGVGYLRP